MNNLGKYSGSKYNIKIKIININEIKKDEETYNPLLSNKELILILDNIENFDIFTERFGSINNDKRIKIRWSEVMEHYKGLGIKYTIDSEFFKDRFWLMKLNGIKCFSWWDDEFYHDAVLFERNYKKN